ncbi:hypothetical protein MTP99_015953 [Tenebrio molitor]|nr:hypothetical protein MTP99_015953 [Tenebrio molitor]
MKILLTFLVLARVYSTIGIVCKQTNIHCLNNHQYQLCFNFGKRSLLLGNVRSCRDGTICDDNKRVPCVNLPSLRAVTLVPTTSTIPTVTAPPCFEASKFPATNCNEYYECVPVWWWWEPRLQICPDGQGFDNDNLSTNDNDTTCYSALMFWTYEISSCKLQ